VTLPELASDCWVRVRALAAGSLASIACLAEALAIVAIGQLMGWRVLVVMLEEQSTTSYQFQDVFSRGKELNPKVSLKVEVGS